MVELGWKSGNITTNPSLSNDNSAHSVLHPYNLAFQINSEKLLKWVCSPLMSVLSLKTFLLCFQIRHKSQVSSFYNDTRTYFPVNRGNGTSSDPNLRVSAPAPWDPTLPLKWVMSATEHRRSLGSYLALLVALPSPTKGITSRIHWRKIWLLLTSDPALPPKLLDTNRLHRDAPT